LSGKLRLVDKVLFEKMLALIFQLYNLTLMSAVQQVAQESEVYLIARSGIMLLFVAFLLFCIGAGVAVMCLLLGLAFGLVAMGVVSTSLVVGIKTKSAVAGVKTAWLLAIIVLAAPVSAVSFWALGRLLHVSQGALQLMGLGGIAGTVAGLIAGWITWKIALKALSLVQRKIQLPPHSVTVH
jgi:hypothetical protein